MFKCELFPHTNSNSAAASRLKKRGRARLERVERIEESDTMSDTEVEETKYAPKTVKDVDAQEFVTQYAKHLKGKVRTIPSGRLSHAPRAIGDDDGEKKEGVWLPPRIVGGLETRGSRWPGRPRRDACLELGVRWRVRARVRDRARVSRGPHPLSRFAWRKKEY